MAAVLSVMTEVRLMYFYYCVHAEMSVYNKEEDNRRQQNIQHVNMWMDIIVFSIICKE